MDVQLANFARGDVLITVTRVLVASTQAVVLTLALLPVLVVLVEK